MDACKVIGGDETAFFTSTWRVGGYGAAPPRESQRSTRAKSKGKSKSKSKGKSKSKTGSKGNSEYDGNYDYDYDYDGDDSYGYGHGYGYGEDDDDDDDFGDGGEWEEGSGGIMVPIPWWDAAHKGRAIKAGIRGNDSTGGTTITGGGCGGCGGGAGVVGRDKNNRLHGSGIDKVQYKHPQY
jgi:hypothetical protein